MKTVTVNFEISNAKRTKVLLWATLEQKNSSQKFGVLSSGWHAHIKAASLVISLRNVMHLCLHIEPLQKAVQPNTATLQ